MKKLNLTGHELICPLVTQLPLLLTPAFTTPLPREMLRVVFAPSPPTSQPGPPRGPARECAVHQTATGFLLVRGDLGKLLLQSSQFTNGEAQRNQGMYPELHSKLEAQPDSTGCIMVDIIDDWPISSMTEKSLTERQMSGKREYGVTTSFKTHNIHSR